MPDDTGRKQDGTFAPGHSGNPNGRPKGARAKLSENFCQALLDDFADHGAAAIIAMRTDRPNEYAKMIAGILSKEISGEDGEDIPVALKVILEGVSANGG